MLSKEQERERESRYAVKKIPRSGYITSMMPLLNSVSSKVIRRGGLES